MECLQTKAEQFPINSSVYNANMLLLIIQEKGLLSTGIEIERENICTFVLHEFSYGLLCACVIHGLSKRQVS